MPGSTSSADIRRQAADRIFVGRFTPMAGISAHEDNSPAAVDSRETGVTADASCLAPARTLTSVSRALARIA
jgi:hypothetical protein